MIVETARVRLRGWHETDRAPFAAMNADPQIMRHLGPPQSRTESDASIDRQIALMAAGEPAFWAAERVADGAFLGFIGVKPISFATPFAPGYEIGWRLAHEHWGKGYASEGARAALDHAFAAYKLDVIYAITVPANLPSQAVMWRIGMTRVAGGDFDHPLLEAGDPLRRHILFRIER